MYITRLLACTCYCMFNDFDKVQRFILVCIPRPIPNIFRNIHLIPDWEIFRIYFECLRCMVLLVQSLKEPHWCKIQNETLLTMFYNSHLHKLKYLSQRLIKIKPTEVLILLLQFYYNCTPMCFQVKIHVRLIFFLEVG